MNVKFISLFVITITLLSKSSASENQALITRQPPRGEKFFFVFPGDRKFKEQCCPLTVKVEDCYEAHTNALITNAENTPHKCLQTIKFCGVCAECIISTPLFIAASAVTTAIDSVYCTCCHLPQACRYHYGSGVVTITDDPESMKAKDRCLACISGIYWFCRWGGTIITTS